jgi:porin
MMRRVSMPALAAVAILAASAQAQAQQAATQPDFWNRDTIGGHWDGLRTSLATQGIVFMVPYTAEGFADIAGGMKRGASYDGLFQPEVDVDLDTLLHWQGASFSASMIQTHGPSMSAGWVGNLLGVSSAAAAPPATRLYNLWLQQTLFGDTLSVRAGLMNADAEFLTSTTVSLFVNGTFGWPAWIGADLPGGGPAYPLSAPGVRVRIGQVPEGFYLQAAAFSGDPTGHDGSNSPEAGIPSGTVISFNGGAFLIAEAGYAVNQGSSAKGPPAASKLGAWYDTSNRFQDQRYATDGLSLADPASTGIPRTHSGDWGIYGVVDVPLYPTPDGGLSGFVRAGGSPGDRNLIAFYADAGLAWQGLLPGRAGDTAGLAVGFARIGNNARGLDQDMQAFGNPLMPVRSQEVVVELSYLVQVTPHWMTLQPDVQYVVSPDGGVLNANGNPRRNAVVLGLHSKLSF